MCLRSCLWTNFIYIHIYTYTHLMILRQHKFSVKMLCHFIECVFNKIIYMKFNVNYCKNMKQCCHFVCVCEEIN